MHPDDDPRDDAELLAVCGHDPPAFGVLHRRHAHDLLAFLRRGTPDAQHALDLLAETMALAYERRARYRPSAGSVRQWLFGIARYELLEHWRSERVRREALARLGVEPPTTDDASIERIDALIDAGRMHPELARAIDALPPGEREAVIARHLHDHDYPEIARRLGISPGAARVRVHRALAKLRLALTVSEDPA